MHFVRELKQQKKFGAIKVELDENLRGKVEKFEHAPRINQPQLDHSKDRQTHAKKYSQQVNEINRKSKSRSPTFGSPKGRFNANDYKKQL